MKSPEKCLLLVISCYLLAMLLSIISDSALLPGGAPLVGSISSSQSHDMFTADLHDVTEMQDDTKANLGDTKENTSSSLSSQSYFKSKKEMDPVNIIKKYSVKQLSTFEKFSDITSNRIVFRDSLQNDLVTHKHIHLNYATFAHSTPKFADSHDKDLFFANKINVNDIADVPKERLQGVIGYLPNTTINRQIDCGWKTPIEQFQKKDYPVAAKYHILCPLLIPDSFAFQHFIDGVLPKLMQAYDLLLRSNVKLLIYKPRDHIVIEMYERLGFNESQLVYYTSGNYFADVMINTCITPPLHPDLWQTARSRLGAPYLLQVPPSEASVILLTRAKAHNSGRSLTNQEDVLHFLLHRYEKRSVLFKGGYSLDDSIAMFSKAKIIIGVHGGAFYNMLFAPKGTHIVEILPTDEHGGFAPRTIAHTIVWQMSNLLEQPYWRISEKPLTARGNVQLSISKLKTILDQIDKS